MKPSVHWLIHSLLYDHQVLYHNLQNRIYYNHSCALLTKGSSSLGVETVFLISYSQCQTPSRYSIFMKWIKNEIIQNPKLGNRRCKYKSCVCVYTQIFSCVQLFGTPWTMAHQAPLSMGFSRQEYWSGLPCAPPKDLPDPGIKPAYLMSPALTGRFFTTSTTWDAQPPQNVAIC